MNGCGEYGCTGLVHRYHGDNHEGCWCPKAIESSGGEPALVALAWKKMTSPQRLALLKVGTSSQPRLGAVVHRLHADGYLRHGAKMYDADQLTDPAIALQAYGKTQPAPKPPKKSEPRNETAVAKAWSAGRRLTGSSLFTDGKSVYSFRLLIGITEGKKKIAYDYRTRVSGSTSRHCGVVIRAADKVVQPPKESR